MILVTGSTGFIGGNFADLLDRKGIEYRAFRGDLRDPVDVKRNLRGVDTVVHFAALCFVPDSYFDPYSHVQVNTMGTLNLLENQHLYDRLVHISTSHIYGRQEEFPIREDAKPNPLDPYSVSKLAAEQLVRVYVDIYGLDAIIIRPFNNFGLRQAKRFFIPKVINDCLLGKPVIVRGDSERDFLYVEDTCRGILAALERGRKGEVYNLCTGEATWVSTVAQLIADLMGVEHEVEVAPLARPLDIPKLQGDNSKAKKDLGWTPEVSLKEGLRRTIEYYRKL